MEIYNAAPATSRRALVWMDATLAQFCQGAQRRIYEIIRAEVLGHKNFQRWPASVTKHHIYQGGLAVHTSEVLDYALKGGGYLDSLEESVATGTRDLRPDFMVLSVAVVMHDFCKIWDYGMDGVGRWVEMPYRRLVRHVSGSHAEFVRLFSGTGLFSEEQYLNVEHCILAHHGRQEHGSPVEPQTLEALLLHHADIVSAKFGPQRIRSSDLAVCLDAAVQPPGVTAGILKAASAPQSDR